MGCAVQVHEKSDTRGTWTYHSVDGWYLSTSPDHYRTHVCHIKSTQCDRLSNTVHFKHKNITNPSLTHAKKNHESHRRPGQCSQTKTNSPSETRTGNPRPTTSHENSHIPTPLPKVTKEQDKQALLRVQTEAMLPRVQTEAISTRVPEATQDKGKQATRSTSHLPVATEQQAPKRRQQTNISQGNVDNTKNTQNRSATA